MKSVKVYLSNNTSYWTNTNGSIEEIKSYFIDKYFEQADGSTAQCAAVQIDGQFYFGLFVNYFVSFEDLRAALKKNGFNEYVSKKDFFGANKMIETINGPRSFDVTFHGDIRYLTSTFMREGRNILEAESYWFYLNAEAAIDLCVQKIKDSPFVSLLKSN